MRRALLVLLLFATLTTPAGAHEVGWPIRVNFLLDHVSTPDLAPGETGTFSLVVNNTYDWRMQNITLRLEIYRYREVDVDRPVDVTWAGPGPYFVDSGGMLFYFIEPPIPPLRPRESVNVSFPVVTYPDTPHGSLTKQGSYFVRTRLEFEFADPLGNMTNLTIMMSKGYFSAAEFDTARTTCPSPTATCVGLLNLTFLGSVYGLSHIDGLLPDSGFSVTEKMPLWPYIAVGGLMVASLVFALLFYAEENPGKYPRLARWWLGLKGRARGARPPKAR